jgi:hypothetical protein
VTDEIAKIVAEATADLAAGRQDVIDASVAAIRALEKQLQDALGRGTLRGLKNLGNASYPIYALRVRGDDHDKKFYAVGARVLCLSANGLLVCVWKQDSDTFDVEVAADHDLFANDLPALSRALAFAIPRHLKQVEESKERWKDLKRIADAIRVALSSEGGAK